MSHWYYDTSNRGQVTYVNQCFGTMWRAVKGYWDRKKAGGLNEVDLAKARQIFHKIEAELEQLGKITQRTD